MDAVVTNSPARALRRRLDKQLYALVERCFSKINSRSDRFEKNARNRLVMVILAAITR
jgi:hypothetical protein